MLRQLVRTAVLGALQRWLGTRAGGREHRRSPGPIHLNMDEIKALALKYATLGILLFLNLLLFVGGLIVVAVAAAQGIDMQAGIAATSVFWAGLIILFTALVLGSLSAYGLTTVRIEAADLVTIEPSEPRDDGLAERAILPLIQGIAEGLSASRRRRVPGDIDRAGKSLSAAS